jgi:hypothetical protein
MKNGFLEFEFAWNEGVDVNYTSDGEFSFMQYFTVNTTDSIITPEST